jgi:hypothetical protein
MSAELLNLPWSALLTLASGYAAYFVANTGLRDHHKAIDVAFSTLVFGFFGAFAYEFMLRVLAWSLLPSSVVAFFFAVIFGGLWRKFGRKLLSSTLRLTDVSHSDDLQSAWRSLFDITSVHATQLSVQLKNGTWLQCDDLARFASAPNGPCVLGASGDILMYVTDSRQPGEVAIVNDAVEFTGWGQEVTYIPASEIARVDLRRKPKSTF